MTDARTLLARIDALAIDPPGAKLRFVDRLARENGWDTAYAKRVLAEYRRFIALAATAPHPVTPSDEVDQAWHLHLAYTRSYWDDLCGDILGRPLHHGPTAGGDVEAKRYRQQYAATLEAYRMAFGMSAPADIWPPLEQRFAARYQRVDRARHWLVPKRPAAIAALLPLAAGCAALVSDEGGGVPPLLGIIIVVGFVLLAVAISRAQSRRRGERDGSGGEGGIDISDGGNGGCGGGCGGD